MILLFFTGAGLLALLAFPAGAGAAARAREAIYGATGFLSFLVPVLLLVSSARLLRPSALPGAFGMLHGLSVNLFFLSALTDIVGRRFNPALAHTPGGLLAGRAVDHLTALAGPLLAYLVLLLGFVLSLAVFTGWDIAGDLAGLSAGLPRRSRTATPRACAPPEPAQGANLWARTSADGQPPALPGFLEDAGGFSPLRGGAVEEERREPQERHPLADSHEEVAAGPVRRPRVDGPAARADGPAARAVHPGILPPDSILMAQPATVKSGVTEAELRERSEILVRKLAEFGVVCEIVDCRPGPVLTRFELRPGPGVKVNSIVGRSDDLALALKARRIRILAPIPGRDAVGIEVPNPSPETVFLRDVLRSVRNEVLPVALGRRMEGEPCVADIADMPHLLVAGATGTGKSVCLHAIICTLLMTKRPDEVRLALIDPKKGTELAAYGDLPHLWAPVVCDSREARLLLEDLVREMEERYTRLARSAVRSISEYNRELDPADADGTMPYIVLIIDELADLMTTSASETEQPIARLAQMARAVGIHLVVATQRPSVDVITGVIKANFPSRIAFMVGSKTDSRTILDMNGAEMLLGRGDMLYLPATSPEPLRIQGSLVSGKETRDIVAHWRDQDLPGAYVFEPSSHSSTGNMAAPGDLDSDDELLRKARDIVIRYQIGSQSLLQRKLRVGFARAGRLMDLLEERGVVGPTKEGRARDVLISREDAGMAGPGDETGVER